MRVENVKVLAGLSALGLSMVGFAHTTASVLGFNKELVAGSVALFAALMVKKAIASLVIASDAEVVKKANVAEALGMKKQTNVSAASGVRIKNSVFAAGAVAAATVAAPSVADLAERNIALFDEDSLEDQLVGVDPEYDQMGGGLADITDSDQLAVQGSALRDLYDLDG